ncbi:MAG: 3-deoxy-7-phosphoheptulonate synthase [Chlamydiota bacterium]|nr:3-deoxy-7-phosphoheptulonate synthase [Chlamydiota bacterium]
MSRDNKINQFQSALPSPGELKSAIPLSTETSEFIEFSRKKIEGILTNKEQSLILIVGPCSIHDPTAALEYASKLKVLAKEVSENFTILMRVYFAKPRTTLGWKGFMYDPTLDGSNEILTGITRTRQLLADLAKQNIMTAAEFLDPMTVPYFEDLITWGCIGSRTSESQTHRVMASGLPMPIAFKNNTDGNIKIAVEGVLVASTPHTFISINEEGRLAPISTQGNPNCHVVLRGGKLRTNYDPQSISETLNQLRSYNLNEKVIIDCSHGNCLKDFKQQTAVFESIINQVIEGNSNISGLILESNLVSGTQSIESDTLSSLQYGQSITDSCIDWTTTENLIRWGHERLTKHNNEQNSLNLETHAQNLVPN